MKKKLLLITALLCCLSSRFTFAQTLIHYWDFNTSTTELTLLTPSTSLVTGASFVHIPGGSGPSVIQLTSNTTGQGFETSNLNARNSFVAGAHLRLNNATGAELNIAMPTTGYKNIIVKYVTEKSSANAAGTQVIDYSTDGSTYTNFTSIAPGIAPAVALETLDFSAITAANNNANFKIRITFTGGASPASGNNRFDNFTVDGTLQSTDVTAPVVSFNPANNSTQIGLNAQPVITFDEDIRLTDNTTIDNSNVDNLVELRLTDGSGTLVAFDATISGKTITLAPSSALLNNQIYYVALKANVIEDLSDNAITTVQAATFTTIPTQTVFQPGDLIPVAYRMNATSTEDEITFLTLVDILPGTIINFTDSKYTDNATPQCPDGLVWTAPAGGVLTGTVISLQTNALVVNIGSVTGSGFGLSSSGDQVIVYTGSASSPNYITALSSKLWVTTNTNCGGSDSKLPAALTDGTNSINMSTATGNVSGNTTNAYYNGSQIGTTAQVKASVLDPANWTSAASGTAPQSWPAWTFFAPCTGVTVATEPVSPSVVAEGNGSATFTISVAGTSPYTYQWQENNVNLAEAGVYSGTNTATLTITNPSIGLDGKTYRCYVTNCSAANDAYSDNTASISVVSSCIAVAISAQPVSPAAVNEGDGVATFTASASGTGPFTYQWQENNVDLTETGAYSGTHAASLTITDPSFSLNGKTYRCLVTNCTGSNTIYTDNTATLTVNKVSYKKYTYKHPYKLGTYAGSDIFFGGFSGLSFIPGSTNEFYTITDRGPNLDANNNPNALADPNAKLFPLPDFNPSIVHFKLQGDSVAIISVDPIGRPDGSAATGMINPLGGGGTGERALIDYSGTLGTPDTWGIDSEGISLGTNDDFWISEEYGTSIWHVSKSTKKVINRYAPFPIKQAQDLPLDTAFKFRNPNKGLEGVAATPNGKVYGFIQNSLIFPATNTTINKNTRLHRFVEIDPATSTTRMLGYEHDLVASSGALSTIKNDKRYIGDAAAVNDHEFLILEHGKSSTESYAKIYKIDISNATAITQATYPAAGNKTFEEFLNAATAQANGVTCVTKTLLIDLIASGYNPNIEKEEGLAIVNDSTIAIANDNDFGVISNNADGIMSYNGVKSYIYTFTLPAGTKLDLDLVTDHPATPPVTTNTTETTGTVETSGISIAPNPTQGYLSIALPAGHHILGLSILNSIGEKIRDIEIPKGSDDLFLDVNNIQSGTYLLLFKTEDGRLITKKMLKN